jgi:hypothetical protein
VPCLPITGPPGGGIGYGAFCGKSFRSTLVMTPRYTAVMAKNIPRVLAIFYICRPNRFASIDFLAGHRFNLS